MPDSQTEIVPRLSSPGLDSLLGVTFPVLNDGFIRAVDYMGCDASIVQAARVSYGTGTKTVHEDDGLIRFLMRHRHTTPFEMCELKLHVRVPMDHWRQWIRHRTASVNEYSTRYSEAIDSIEKTAAGDWRSQSKKNKQGSADPVTHWPEGFDHSATPDAARTPPGLYLSVREKELHRHALDVYQERLTFGVAREQARKDLPLSNYTEAYWKIDLHNLFHFLSLRMDPHAQLEIRLYANAIAEIVKAWVPSAWRAFRDYRLGATFLTTQDTRMIAAVTSRPEECAYLAREFGWHVRRDDGSLKSNRERDEFDAKAEKLGVRIDWNEILKRTE